MKVLGSYKKYEFENNNLEKEWKDLCKSDEMITFALDDES